MSTEESSGGGGARMTDSLFSYRPTPTSLLGKTRHLFQNLGKQVTVLFSARSCFFFFAVIVTMVELDHDVRG